MQFTPKTAEEVTKEECEFREKMLLPKGEYDFEVLAAEHAVSKKGNDMIKLKLKVFDKDGNEHFLFDYLLGSMEHKLFHFAHGTGLGDMYDHGELSADACMGRAGKVKLKVETDEKYGSKNSVQDYIGQRPPSVADLSAEELLATDDCPF